MSQLESVEVMAGSFRVLRYLAILAVAALAPALTAAQTPTTPAAVAPVTARQGMVVAQEARAAKIGVEILQKGGNAVDAAVATGFALAVTYPRAGNIGGGGFMLIHLARRGANIAIDYRETAPAAVTRDTFLDAQGVADPARSRDSALAIGVPGTVAGLALAHAKYGSGRFTLAQLIAPAIAFARDGIPVTDDVADSLPRAQARLARWPASAKIFLKPDGRVLAEGDRLVQRDLADTLAAIAREGPTAFYEGPVAEKIVAAVRAAGGVMTRDDLRNYRAVERAPVRGTYRGYRILSMPPPSSGGVHLVQMLNILEGYRIGESRSAAADRMHLMIETMKRAYADRAFFLGDPDQVQVPVARLTSKSYAAFIRTEIDRKRARPATDVRAGNAAPSEGANTTHFSVIDRFGNAVANTYTLNFSYGVGLVADGTGILLNNELDDFAAQPGAPNAFGLIGYSANAPGPGKRPLSSMTPTVVLKDGKVFLVTGSPGGSRIITTVLQVIVNVIDRGMPLADAVAAPRIHHQWLPDEVVAETGVPADLIAALAARGHTVVERRPATSANSIVVNRQGAARPAGVVGAADPRTRGALAAGY
jgi:gamma-glutamyltranspeptidase/glutathione hydrolase